MPHRVYGEEHVADLYAHDREEQRRREAPIGPSGEETVAGVGVGRWEVPVMIKQRETRLCVNEWAVSGGALVTSRAGVLTAW